MKKQNKCQNCGESNSIKAKFCHICGKELTKKNISKESEKQRPIFLFAIHKIFSGGILAGISFLIIPIFFVIGYAMKSIIITLEGKDEAPSWKGLNKIFKQGITGFFIIVIYLVIPIFILHLAITNKLILLQIISSILMILIGILLPIAFILYLKNLKYSYAFKLSKVFAIFKQSPGRYFMAYFLILLYSVLFSIFLNFTYDSLRIFLGNIFGLIYQLLLQGLATFFLFISLVRYYSIIYLEHNK